VHEGGTVGTRGPAAASGVANEAQSVLSVVGESLQLEAVKSRHRQLESQLARREEALEVRRVRCDRVIAVRE
jgi:hypothetical protein